MKKVKIVSLSGGILGEDFAKHEVEIGLRRLKEYGLKVEFAENALKGCKYLKEHPEARAKDLLNAFGDPETDMILCAIGGDDTYRLLPYLFENNELKRAVSDKIFLGFSDTTINHLMLHKVGLNTFYGQAFLPDVCELDTEMLPYTRRYFEELLHTGTIREIRPSEVWYEERTDFGESALGTKRNVHNNKGFCLLQGKSVFQGEILGGCIESMYDIFNNDRYEDSVRLCQKYHLFPSPEDWNGKILLLETSEEQPVPEEYRKMALALKQTGIFERISGMICGNPMDEKYADAYQNILMEVTDNPELPIVWDINVGHATPRCIIPLGIFATVDAGRQVIRFRQSGNTHLS